MVYMSVIEYLTKKEVDLLKALKHLKRINMFKLQRMDLLCYSDMTHHHNLILQKER